jgi:hypothetical protein
LISASRIRVSSALVKRRKAQGQAAIEASSSSSQLLLLVLSVLRRLGCPRIKCGSLAIGMPPPWGER